MRSRFLIAAAITVQLQWAAGLVDQYPLVVPDRISKLDLNPLPITNRKGSDVVMPGTELRVLFAGDSITLGTLSDSDGGDGNGFRLRFRDGLRKDEIIFAGTETVENGNMSDGYFAAWPGKTIQYISEHVGQSLEQRPNIILLHAGTNDMNPNKAIATEGNDPVEASKRLGSLIDKMVSVCSDAVVLVAMIIDTCDPAQSRATKLFQTLVPGVVQQRLDGGKHVLAVNFTSFPTSELRDCIHPTNKGYALLGDYWINALTQVPKEWIRPPRGKDPMRSSAMVASSASRSWLFISLVLAFLYFR